MKDYSKTKIYIIKHIFDVDGKNAYIGSTTNWAVRNYQHKRRCNDPTDRGYNFNLYKFVRKFGGFQNFIMQKIEDFPCKNKKESSTRERFWIEKYNSKLNMQKPSEL